MWRARSILSFGLRVRSSPSSLIAFTRVACSPTASPTERAIESPALWTESMIEGVERRGRGGAGGAGEGGPAVRGARLRHRAPQEGLEPRPGLPLLRVDHAVGHRP